MKLRCLYSVAFLVFACVIRAKAQPVIHDQPREVLDAKLHDPVEFTVGATGNDPLFFQWRLNNVPIPGATDSNYKIDKIQPEHGGIYSVVVSDDKGDAISDDAALTLDVKKADGNDLLKNAYVLENKGDGIVRGDNKDATVEIGEPKHQGKTGGKSIWFRWVAPTNGIVTFRTAGSTFDTLLGIYIGSDFERLTLVPGVVGDDDRGGYFTSLATFNAVAQQEYHIAVDGFYGASGIAVLSWDFEETDDHFPSILQDPPNRTLGLHDRLDLSVLADEGSTLEWFFDGISTKVPGGMLSIPSVDENNVGHYSTRIQRQGRDTIREVFSDDADIQINISDGGNTDTNVAALNKFFSATEGENGGKGKPAARSIVGGGSNGTSSLGASHAFTTTQIFSTVGATKDPGEPNHCGVAGGASEWFLYQAPGNGTLHINTDGSSFNTVLAVYTATSFDFSSLVPVACANNSSGNTGEHVRFSASNGKYYYIAVDGVGGASGTVHLNIALGTPPSISSHPQSKSVIQGTNASFSATASGTAPLSYQWKFNGTNISGATSSAYTRTNVQPSHAGAYSVTVSNAINVTTSSNAILTVLTAPQISSSPTNQTAMAGGNPVFAVVASGSNPLSYQWRFNGTNILNATNSSYTLFNVQLTNAGNYSVQVTNSVGSATSADAVLTVNAAPLISLQPASKTVSAGSNPSLSVVASAFPPPAYQWQFKNGNIAGGVGSLLTITNFQTANEGAYQVIVTNSFGSVTSSIALLYLNSPPRFGSFSKGTNGSFQLQFLGIANSNYVFEFSTNLPTWWPIATNSSPDGFISFADTNTIDSNFRFYRTVQQ